LIEKNEIERKKKKKEKKKLMKKYFEEKKWKIGKKSLCKRSSDNHFSSHLTQSL